MKTMPKEYLGDGAYAAMNENGQLVLTAENGLGATDTIYFDISNVFQLKDYVDRYIKESDW